MIQFFRAFFERFRAKFTVDSGLDFEAKLIARDAERKAVLLRRAAQYDNEGLHHVAGELRQRAEAISFHRPLASLLSGESMNDAVASQDGNGQNRLPQLANQKKK